MVLFNKEVEQKLITAIQWSWPQEICGFLLNERDNPIASQVHFGKNLSGEINSFIFSPADQERIFRFALNNQLRVTALIHSHPYNTEASEADINFMPSLSLPWIIVVLEKEKLIYRWYSNLVVV